MELLVQLLTLVVSASLASGGILFPRESESREVKSLDGVWDFRRASMDDQEAGFREEWYLKDLKLTGDVMPMPVPSSYNDVTQDKSIRDHIGWVWYDRRFFVTQRWKMQNYNVFLRFGSVNYEAIVWVNGVQVANHSGGHLPFQADITDKLAFGEINRVTVAVNNTLTPHTVPQGTIKIMNDTSKYPPGYMIQTFNFDFFNYAGIDRPVYLYTTPHVYVDDITVVTDIVDNTAGVIEYSVTYSGEYNSVEETPEVNVSVIDQDGAVVAQSTGLAGIINIKEANFWWPYLTRPNPGYLYTLQVTLELDNIVDTYRLPVGIRTVSWSNTTFYINNEPFYFTGFGRHEDYDIRGRGLDNPLVTKDYNLIKWVGANSYRTSHYPYAEEILDFADREGIVIIDECPAIGVDGFDDQLLEKHKAVLEELIQRDKNRPSVVMWSLSNEPQSQKTDAGPYFSEVIFHTKSLDPVRPVTIVTSQQYSNDKAAEFVDVICVNRYSAWYSDTGMSELIQRQTESEFTEWHKKFNKPVLMSEYGAGSVPGFHADPAFTWTEDYQVVTMREHFKAFDNLRSQGFFIGEMIWNFADFATPQEYFRPQFCMKGIFTRQRQPKAAAHFMRRRYWDLANEIYGVPLPKDLYPLY